MRRITSIILLCFSFLVLQAQDPNIVAWQYWFDEDYSASVTQTTDPTEHLSVTENIATNGLAPGIHRMFVRFKDNRGYWSSPVVQFVYKRTLSDDLPDSKQITHFQYWFDEADAEAVTQPTENTEGLILINDINMNVLAPGIHRLFLRFKDNYGQWSSPSVQFVYKRILSDDLPDSKQITHFQYWFDEADAEAVTQATESSEGLVFINDIATTALAPGIHRLFVRFKDNYGQWSSPYIQFVYKRIADDLPDNKQITHFQYWFDEADAEAVTQATESSDNLVFMNDVALNNLSVGIHRMFIRFKDNHGKWSVPIVQSVYYQGLSVGNTYVVQYRYWFNNDIEQAEEVDLDTPVNPLFLVKDVSLKHLPEGNHVLHYQFKNNWNVWSVVTSDTIHKNLLPTADFSYTENIACNQAGLTFNNTSVDCDTYAWDFGDGSSSTEENPEHTYTESGEYEISLIVQHIESGLSDTVTKTFVFNKLSVTNANLTHILCYGNNTGSINIDVLGGTGAYTYAWSNGATTEDLQNVPADTYTFTVTDEQACTVTQTFTLTQPQAFILSLNNLENVDCHGASSGNIDINVDGGTAPYTFVWTNSQGIEQSAEEDLEGVPADTYTIQVTDNNACTLEAQTYTLAEPSAIEITAEKTDITCFGANDGTINISVSGGTGDYTYVWSNGFNEVSTQQNLSGLDNLTYTVEVTDANNCTQDYSVEILEPNEIQFDIVTEEPSCEGSDGNATVQNVVGASNYTYTWNTGSTEAYIDNIPSGTYSVEVKDEDAECSAIKSFFLENSESISLNPTVVNVSCPSCNDGSITLDIIGGQAPYTVQWDNGATELVNTELYQGSYSVTVSDAGNCVVTDCIALEVMQELSVSVSKTDATACGLSDGTATVVAYGGVGNYTYQWNSVPEQNTSTATGLSAGLYYCTITDEANDFLVVPVAVGDSISDVPMLTFSTRDTTCYLGFINTDYAGENGTETYLWSMGANTPNIYALDEGWYSLLVEDTGCQSAVNVKVQPEAPWMQEICMVTVDPVLNHNLVVWESIQSESVDHYNIYRDDCSGNPALVGSVASYQLTVFEDITARPDVQSYTYRISAVNECGVESPMSPIHKTMHLDININSDASMVHLSWDDYIGFENPTFKIYKNIGVEDNDLNTWQLLAEVNNTDYSYVDTYNMNDTVYYAIAVSMSDGEYCYAGNNNFKANGGPYYQSISNLEDDGRIYVGVSDISKDGWHIYPNPAKGSLNIESDEAIQSISIYDAVGKCVRQFFNVNREQVHLNTEMFSKGVYVFEVQTQSQNIKHQVVIE